MKYRTIERDGIIIAISKNGSVGKTITAEEYAEIMAMLRNPPAALEGYGYRLTESLQWELYELPPVDPDPELSDQEALDIILEGDGA